MADTDQGYTPRHTKTGNTGAGRRVSAASQSQSRPANDAPSASNRPAVKHSRKAAGGSYFTHDAKRASGKDRPVRGKGRYIAIAVIVVVVIAVCVVGATHIVGKLGGPAIEAGKTVTVTIDEGSSTKSIASKLKSAGIIGDETGFVKYVTDAGNANSLLPGVYTLTTGSDNETVMQALLSGPGASGIQLTVPEGYTIEQTAARVEEVCGIPAADFITLAHSATTYEADYPFLVGAYDNSLEGYLFPKTYSVPDGATADTVIRLMLDQFSIETASLDLTYATSKGLGFQQVVTMASLIEEEAFFDADRAHIAGVLYNRLDEGMYLGLDVSVYYAIGRTDGSALSSEDLAADSPYNTYVNKGLPPGPISSPGLASLQAAASPAETSDLFFILTSDYSNFYETYDDFLVGKAAYQAEGNG